MVTKPRMRVIRRMKDGDAGVDSVSVTWTTLQVPSHFLRHSVVEPQFMKAGVPGIGIIK